MSLSIHDLTFGYRRHRTVLDRVSIDVGDGTILGLLGPNGCGKSTLIKCVVRILRPAKGQITIDGQATAGLSQRQLARLVAYVPQAAETPFPQSVFDVVLLGRTPYTSFKTTAEDRRKVAAVLERLSLEDLAFEMYSELSGGQRQRVLLARAVVQEPRVLLLDEPTTFLDLRHQLEALLAIGEIVVERNITALIAIHDLNLATRFTDRVAVLHGGTVVAEGEASCVLEEALIAEVYGVESVVEVAGGQRMVVPVAPIDDVHETRQEPASRAGTAGPR